MEYCEAVEMFQDSPVLVETQNTATVLFQTTENILCSEGESNVQLITTDFGDVIETLETKTVTDNTLVTAELKSTNIKAVECCSVKMDGSGDKRCLETTQSTELECVNEPIDDVDEIVNASNFIKKWAWPFAKIIISTAIKEFNFSMI